MTPINATTPSIDVADNNAPPHSCHGEWTWEMVTQFPRQGDWTVEEYLSLNVRRLVEYEDGALEFLSMPTVRHQTLLGWLYRLLDAWCAANQRPSPLLAPMPVQIRFNKYREPDLLLPRERQSATEREIQQPVWVLEIVSPDDKSQKRDLVTKRAEYAAAGIPEYWIVDPETETITVLTLPAGQTEYAVHGEFRPGQQANSVLLPGFTVDVTACFAAGTGANFPSVDQ